MFCVFRLEGKGSFVPGMQNTPWPIIFLSKSQTCRETGAESCGSLKRDSRAASCKLYWNTAIPVASSLKEGNVGNSQGSKLTFKLIPLMILAGLLLAGNAMADSFFMYTNDVGFSGTVTYTPLGSTTEVVTDTATRNASIYALFGYPGYSDYFSFLNNWSDHPPSNTSNSFFQLKDSDASSVTSTNGGWDTSMPTTFSATVTGTNAVYDETPSNDWSRAWTPDQSYASGGDIAPRGTWLNYTLTLVATGTPVYIDDNWYWNVTDPSSITGTFSGTFVSEARTYYYDSGAVKATIAENTYVVNLNLSSSLRDPNPDNYSDDGFEANNYFASPTPEPASMLLFGSGLAGLAYWRRRRNRS
jgi:hypothetical protein